MTVKIIVDSGSDISLEDAAQEGIIIVPAIISFGTEEYFDGIDLDNQSFYEMLKKSPTLPKTAAPSIKAFEEAYHTAIRRGATEILSIHISGELSGALNVASLAAEMVQHETDIPIQIVDSRTMSAGFGLPALLAAKLAREGASLESTHCLVQDVLSRTDAYFVLNTLEYLQKGGRISKTQSIIGTALHRRPILSINEGEVVLLGHERTFKKALSHVIEYLKEQEEIEHVSLAVSNNELAEEVGNVICQIYSGPIKEFTFGAGIGTHAGPHALGIFITRRAKRPV